MGWATWSIQLWLAGAHIDCHSENTSMSAAGGMVKPGKKGANAYVDQTDRRSSRIPG